MAQLIYLLEEHGLGPHFYIMGHVLRNPHLPTGGTLAFIPQSDTSLPAVCYAVLVSMDLGQVMSGYCVLSFHESYESALVIFRPVAFNEAQPLARRSCLVPGVGSRALWCLPPSWWEGLCSAGGWGLTGTEILLSGRHRQLAPAEHRPQKLRCSKDVPPWEWPGHSTVSQPSPA